MNAKDKKTDVKTTLKQNVKVTAVESAEKLEKIAKEATSQALDVVTDVEEKFSAEVEQLNQTAQSQLAAFKQEVLNRLEIIKSQVNLSQKDLIELKGFVKAELNVVIEELTKLGREIKQDVSQISLKHKDQLTETFKRSKEHTLEAWNKVSSK